MTILLLSCAAAICLAPWLRDLCRPSRPGPDWLDAHWPASDARTIEQRDMDDRAWTHATIAPAAPASAPIGASGASPTDLMIQALAIRAGTDGEPVLKVRPCDRRCWPNFAMYCGG